MQPCATRIRKARIDAGLSQTELAVKVGVQRSAVSQWERPEGTLPSVAHLIHVALATTVQFEWLATGRGARSFQEETPLPALNMEDFAQDEVESQVLQLLRQMTSKKRKLAFDVLRLIAT